MELFFILIWLPAIIASIDFVGFLIKGKRVIHIFVIRLIEIDVFLILPYLYISSSDTNQCCGDSSAFSPEHRLTIWVYCIICAIAYFYSSYRSKIAPPVLEVIVNCLLLSGIVLNIFIAIQTDDRFLIFLGNMPMILFGILVLVKNQRAFISQADESVYSATNHLEKLAWKILTLEPLLKFPIIFVVCLPIILIVTAILILVGQKPDSLIRAFTDTYKHGFSQWDYQCDNVVCGGHYLCSVAANGHAEIVKPKRFGDRHGNAIICNRQLLISNAFEELVEEHLPVLHKFIRFYYNKVGDCIHRYYGIFNNKFISDLIYFLMKPLEWFFLLVLYSVDRKPENRIARQYMSIAHIKEINRLLNDEHLKNLMHEPEVLSHK